MMDSRSDCIRIPVAALEEGPYRVEGRLSNRVLDLANDPVVGETEDIVYSLAAEKLGDEIIVTGTVQARLQLACRRTGRFFWTSCGDFSFVRAFRFQGAPAELELTEEVREAVVAEIPPYPLSPEAQSQEFVPPDWVSGLAFPEDAVPDAWSSLDGLDLPDGE